MSELEFEKTALRTSKVPENQRREIEHLDGVRVELELDRGRIAYYARTCTWLDPFQEPDPDEFKKVLTEVAEGKVLSASKFGDFAFKIRASRLVMDQLLRMTEIKAGAQTTRDNDFRDYDFVIPRTIQDLLEDDTLDPALMSFRGAALRWLNWMREGHDIYGDLIDTGMVPPQEARYGLPLGAQTNWIQCMDLLSLEKMCEQRMCNGLIQPETDFAVRLMRDLYVQHEPWTDKMLRSGCEKKGKCTGGGMLFPPCGAFVDEGQARAEGTPLETYRLEVTHFDSSKHLFPGTLNAATEFAMWDIDRLKLEERYPEIVYSMAGPPIPLCSRAPNMDWAYND